MSKSLDIIIKATTKGLNDTKRLTQTISGGFKKGRLAVKAFNSTARGAEKTINNMAGSIKGLVGAYLGFEGMSLVTNVVKNADAAIFNMSSSVKAANREFGNIGSLSDWEETVSRLSSQLVIYSDTALKNAVSRTVDMTKRLGLNREQMEMVIKRSADLGAGKVELVDSIERVTAALRGEAEASEYLGLTLNENYVKSWYKASGAHKQAWKDLSDVEKAQVRYQVLLEQSAELQGKAADSAQTFGGAMMLVNKEMENAIVNNDDVTQAMVNIAEALRENSGEVGKLVAQFVGGVGKIIQFGIEYKNMLLIIAGTGVAVVLIGKLTQAVKGLNAAWAIMTGLSLIPWFGALKVAAAAVTAQVLALSVATQAFIVLAVAKLIYDLTRLNKAFWEWRDAAKAAKEAQDRLLDTTHRIMMKYKEFKDVKIPDDIAGKSFDELTKLNNALIKARAYYVALMTEVDEKSSATNWLGKPTEEAKQAKAQLGGVLARLNAISAAARETKAALATAIKTKKTDGGKDNLTDEQRKQILKDQAKLEQQLAAELIEISGDKWTVLRNKAKKHYDDQVALAHGNKKMMADAEKIYSSKINKIKTAQQKEILAKEKALSTAQIKSQNERLQDMTQTALAGLQSTYGRAEISLSSYFEKRRALIENQYEYEVNKLSKQLDTETDEVKKIQLEDALFKLKQNNTRELIALKDEELAAEKTLAENKVSIEKMLADMKLRTSQGVASALNAQFAQELADMDRRHNEEIDRLNILTAKKEQIDEAYRLQKLEKERQLVDQERRLYEYRTELAAGLAGSMSDIFKNFYEATGENNKDLFALYQGFAVAEATMAAYLAASKAWAEGGIMGKVQAGITLVGALAYAAKIKAQSLATGGAVAGHSPSDTADNVPIWATAGEFMQPISAVKYYGKGFMEAIRKRLIPRDIFKGFRMPSVPSYNSFALAGGGGVPAGSPGNNFSMTIPIHISRDNENLARTLKAELEDTAIRVMRREIG